MKEANKDKLNKLLSHHKESKEKREKEVKEEQIKVNTFLDDFENFSESNIKPIMNEIGETIKSSGHDYSINYKRQHTDSDKRNIDSKIIMEIYPNGNGRGGARGKAAHIMFYADEYKKVIGVHENNIVPSGGGGSAGRRTYSYTFDTLSNEKIESEIIEAIGNIL